MKLFLIFLILLTRKTQTGGLSHTPRNGWKQLFLISEDPEAHFLLDGLDSGVKGQGNLYLSPQRRDVLLQVFRDGAITFECTLLMNQSMSFFMEPSAQPVAQEIQA